MKWVSNFIEARKQGKAFRDAVRVLQAHKSQSDWRPDTAVSLFVKIVLGGAILEWVQPTSTNPYMKGDKVLWQGKVYESLIDNNVWSPTGYPQGWKIIN